MLIKLKLKGHPLAGKNVKLSGGVKYCFHCRSFASTEVTIVPSMSDEYHEPMEFVVTDDKVGYLWRKKRYTPIDKSLIVESSDDIFGEFVSNSRSKKKNMMFICNQCVRDLNNRLSPGVVALSGDIHEVLVMKYNGELVALCYTGDEWEAVDTKTVIVREYPREFHIHDSYIGKLTKTDPEISKTMDRFLRTLLVSRAEHARKSIVNEIPNASEIAILDAYNLLLNNQQGTTK